MTPAENLIYVKNLATFDNARQQHSRAVISGTEVRVARGVYLRSADWGELTPRKRYVARVHAVSATRRNRPVLSHWSAAAIWGLPFIGEWPEAVHTIVGRTAGGRSRHGVIKHSIALADEDVVEVDGLLVTSLHRTVIDLACVEKFRTAVVAADFVLLADPTGSRPTLATPEQLWAAWERAHLTRGAAGVPAVLEASVTISGSVLESVSRVNMSVIGCPKPVLQQAFYDHRGHIGDADFSWEDDGLIGEADGQIKYLDARYRSGKTADEVVLAEKIREDRLRALPRKVTRWGWSVGIDAAALRAHLERAGLQMGKPW